MNDTQIAARLLGRAGGRAGRGPAKSHPTAIRAWWDSPAGQRRRGELKLRHATKQPTLDNLTK